MKSAADFRRTAAASLSGRWGISILAGLIASAIGATISVTPQFNFDVSFNNSDFDLDALFPNMDSAAQSQLTGLFIILLLIIFSAALAAAAVQFVFACMVEVGYTQFNLDLVDRQKHPSIGTLFRYFKHWKTIVPAQLLLALYVILWTLLFIVPGIIASYNYAMTSYILSEHPDLSAHDALNRSKQMMYGNRFRLFCLQLSFIGWDLLCIFTCGVGNLWLTPYKMAATAAFYREISGTQPVFAAPQM